MIVGEAGLSVFIECPFHSPPACGVDEVSGCFFQSFRWIHFGAVLGVAVWGVKIKKSEIEATNRMAIRIKARSGEPVEQMMRRFKKLCEKEGLNKDIKRKQFYEKPSERRRRDKRKSIKRHEPTMRPS